jgi:hypothetical protein
MAASGSSGIKADPGGSDCAGPASTGGSIGALTAASARDKDGDRLAVGRLAVGSAATATTDDAASSARRVARSGSPPGISAAMARDGAPCCNGATGSATPLATAASAADEIASTVEAEIGAPGACASPPPTESDATRTGDAGAGAGTGRSFAAMAGCAPRLTRGS